MNSTVWKIRRALPSGRPRIRCFHPGYHPTAGLPAFLDALQVSAHSSEPPGT